MGAGILTQVTINIPVDDKLAVTNDEEVKQAVRVVENRLGQQGRILLRESGTEPVVRVMVEAETKLQCQEYAEYVVNIIKSRKGMRGC